MAKQTTTQILLIEILQLPGAISACHQWSCEFEFRGVLDTPL